MKSRDLTDSYLIIPMPCGCSVEVWELDMYDMGPDKTGEDVILVECPWCETVIDRRELNEWHNGTSPEFVQKGPHPLAEADGKIVYAVGHCPCGCPLAVAIEDKERKPFHLRVPLQSIRLLEN